MTNTNDPTKPGWRPSSMDTRQTITEQAAAFAQDLRTINEEFYAEAKRRGWCDEFKDFAHRVNGKLHRTWLVGPEPTKRLTIEVTVDYTPGAWSPTAHAIYIGDVVGRTVEAAANKAADSSAGNIKVSATHKVVDL